jgi:hypothetical protein
MSDRLRASTAWSCQLLTFFRLFNALLQGSSKLEAGALTFRNNYAMNQGYSGMPDR